MEVSMPAQRPAMHAGPRRCTWTYETKNETAQIGSTGWPGQHGPFSHSDLRGLAVSSVTSLRMAAASALPRRSQ